MSHFVTGRSVLGADATEHCLSGHQSLHLIMFMMAVHVQALAAEVACYLGLDLSPIKIKRFADGEIYVALEVHPPPAHRSQAAPSQLPTPVCL